MRKILAGIFRFIARLLAGIFSILFVLTAVAAFVLLNLNHTLLNAGIYKQALAANQAYEKLPTLVAEQIGSLASTLANPCASNPLGCALEGASPELTACLTKALGPQALHEIGTGTRSPSDAEKQAAQPCLDQYQGGQPQASSGGTSQGSGAAAAGPMPFLNALTPQDWQAVIAFLLPPDELRPMTETTLNQIFAYLNGQKQTVSLSLVPLKAHLSGQSGKDLIGLLLKPQPPCTQDQLSQLNAPDFLTQAMQSILCSAAGAARDLQESMLQGLLSQAAAGIPDEVVLLKPVAASSASAGGGPLGNNPVQIFHTVRLGILLSPLVPLVFLLLVTLFGVRSLKGWLLGWGIPLLLSGLICLGIGIALLPVLGWAWVRFVLPRIPVLFASSSLVPFGFDLVRSIVRSLATWIMIEAGLLFALALGAVIGARFVKPRQKAPLADPAFPAV